MVVQSKVGVSVGALTERGDLRPVASDASDLVATVTAFAALLAALVALIALILEGRRIRLQLGTGNMWRLIDQWDHPGMRRLRARVAQRLLDDPQERESISGEALDVLNIFELMGYLVRSKTLKLEDAWVNVSSWATSWWYVYERPIKQWQEQDVTSFEDYAALVEKFTSYESRRRRLSKEDVLPREEDLQHFLEEESKLLLRLPDGEAP